MGFVHLIFPVLHFTFDLHDVQYFFVSFSASSPASLKTIKSARTKKGHIKCYSSIKIMLSYGRKEPDKNKLDDKQTGGGE